MTHLTHAVSFGEIPLEIIVDNSAGGGGASIGIGMALGRSQGIAIQSRSWPHGW